MSQLYRAERWRSISGYEGCYEVSDRGNVRSLDRINAKGCKIKGGVMTLQKVRSGYLVAQLYKNRRYFHATVGRLVATAFISNPIAGQEVNHINGVKSDNRVENLEWVTPSENTRHAVRTGLFKAAAGTRSSRAKFTEADVQRILERVSRGEPMRRVAMDYGVYASTVENIVHGKSWKCVPRLLTMLEPVEGKGEA